MSVNFLSNFVEVCFFFFIQNLQFSIEFLATFFKMPFAGFIQTGTFHFWCKFLCFGLWQRGNTPDSSFHFGNYKHNAWRCGPAEGRRRSSSSRFEADGKRLQGSLSLSSLAQLNLIPGSRRAVPTPSAPLLFTRSSRHVSLAVLAVRPHRLVGCLQAAL